MDLEWAGTLEPGCVANCNYGTYWDGSACTNCPEDTYLGFETYSAFSDPNAVIPIATYNENKAFPQYGDGTDDSVCTPCPTLDLYFALGTSSVTGDKGDDEGLSQCQFAIGF